MTYSSTPQLAAAPWGRRFAAGLVDAAIFVLPAFALYWAALADLGFEPLPLWVWFLYPLTPAALLGLYAFLMHGTLGRTLGKMAFGIRVIKDDGTPCDLAAAAKRACVYPLVGAFPYAGHLVTLLNGLWPLWDERNQSLGDKVAGTYVVIN
jgi:uncharacterized RDD family membrane protein YckC